MSTIRPTQQDRPMIARPVYTYIRRKYELKARAVALTVAMFFEGPKIASEKANEARLETDIMNL